VEARSYAASSQDAKPEPARRARSSIAAPKTGQMAASDDTPMPRAGIVDTSIEAFGRGIISRTHRRSATRPISLAGLTILCRTNHPQGRNKCIV
jgi:hypothetical protein